MTSGVDNESHGWKTVRLRRCLTAVDSGSRPSGGAENRRGEIFSVGAEHIDDEGGFDFSTLLFVPQSHYERIKNSAGISIGDILINRDGAKTGRVALVRPGFPHLPACINEHVFRLRANAEVADATYLFYCLLSPEGQKQIARNIRVSAQGGITTRFVNHVTIDLPGSREEQRAIAQILDALENTIDCIRRKLEAARRLKTALAQQLLTGGIPGRHNKFKRTKIGTIPGEWDVVPLGSLAEIDAGVALNPGGGPGRSLKRYLTAVNVQREGLNLSEIRHVELRESEIPGKLLREGDIIAVEGHTNTSEIGRSAIVTAAADGMAYQNHLFRIRLRADADLNNSFLLGCLNSERGRRHWSAMTYKSNGLNTISRRELRKLPVPKPKRDEQDEIAALTGAANENIRSAEQELLSMRRLKTSLLQNLLTGKVRVKLEVAGAAAAQ